MLLGFLSFLKTKRGCPILGVLFAKGGIPHPHPPGIFEPSPTHRALDVSGAVTRPPFLSLAGQFVAPGHHFEFGPDCVRYGNYRTRLHRECREHRTKLVHQQRIVAVHQ